MGRLRTATTLALGVSRMRRRPSVLGVASLVVCVVALGLSMTVSGSSGSPRVRSETIPIQTLKGKILFTRAGGKFGDETVFTATASGRRVQRITGFGKTCCPRWAADGKHIVIGAQSPDGRITTGIVNPDGSHERKVPLPSGTLNLGCASGGLPKSGLLACEGWDDADPGRSGLYTLRAADGGDLMQVTHSTGGHDIPMDFAPDGSRIFFLREATKSLFVVNADGSDLHRVTPATMRVGVVGNAGGRLSPDGLWIVFTKDGAIWMIRSDGSGLKKIFRDRKGREAITPTWSPNGQLILFGLGPGRSTATPGQARPNALYVITAHGTKLTRVLASPDWKREPDWTR
jgi:Tol biopolymer transport system component